MLVDPLMTVWGLNTSTEAFIVILSLCASTFPSGQSSLPYNSAQSLPTQRHGHRFYRPAALPATRVNHRQATPRLSSLSLLQNRQREPRCQLRRLHSAPYTWHTDLLSRRYVDFANTSFGELEQLAQVCEPASFGINDKDVLDETYRKAGKMDSELFSTPLASEHTDLVKVLRGHLLEATDSTRKLNIKLYKPNAYRMYLRLS